MRRTLFLILCWAVPQGALAGPDYSAADIIKHFQQNAAKAAVAPAAPSAQTEVTVGGADGEATLSIPRTGRHKPITAESGAAKPRKRVRIGAEATASGYDLLITFESGSDQLTDQARNNLDQFARALANPALADLRFLVEGHTDAHGEAAYNQALSDKRAASVVRYLTGRGVAANRLEARGYGETRPRTDDPFAPLNRRVETRVLR